MANRKYKTVGIIGGGALGSAVGGRLTAAKVRVEYWDTDPQRTTAASMEELVQTSELVLICTPSTTNRVVARAIFQAELTGVLPAVLSLAKGVEPGFVTTAEILEAELSGAFPHGVLSGPMLAAEIATGQPTEAVVGMLDPVATESVRALFASAGINLRIARAPRDAALCGVLKNIYALALGLHDGLGYGTNSKSSFTVNILSEFRALLAHLGADIDLAYGPAGLGDLLTTGWSGASFNYSVGRSWAQGQHNGRGEGFISLRELPAVAPLKQFPIAQAVHAVFFEGAEPGSIRPYTTG